MDDYSKTLNLKRYQEVKRNLRSLSKAQDEHLSSKEAVSNNKQREKPLKVLLFLLVGAYIILIIIFVLAVISAIVLPVLMGLGIVPMGL